MKRLKLLLILAFLLINTGVCSAQENVEYQTRASDPPFSFWQQGHLRGFNIDLLDLIFNEADYHVYYSADSWDKIYNRLTRGEIDVCGPLVISRERKRELLFSKPVLETKYALYTKNSAARINLRDLKNYRVGVCRGYYAENILRNNLKVNHYTTFVSPEEGFLALMKGKIDVFLEDQAVGSYFLHKGWGESIIPQLSNLFPVTCAYGVSKNRPDLVLYMNRRIDDLQRSGAYEAIYQKYFFSHSPHYYQQREEKIKFFVFFLALAIIVIIILVHDYIKYLNRKVLQATSEQKKEKRKLKESYQQLEVIYEELAATNTELWQKIQQLEEKERALYLSEERYRLALEASNDVVWDWNMQINQVFYSSRAREVFGYDQELLQGQPTPLEYFIHPEDLMMVQEAISAHLRKKTPYYQAEYRVKTVWGNYKWVSDRGKAFWGKDGQAIRMISCLTDVSQQKKAAEKIHQLAYYDQLTGLLNRTSFNEKLSYFLNLAQQENKLVGVLFLDLDNFKAVNDTLGHSFGDEVIKQLGEILKKGLQPSQLAARLGGDEFVILIPSCNSRKKIEEAAKNILTALQQLYNIEGQEFYSSGSIGIAVYPQDGNNREKLLRNADTALYKAKELGKNTYQFYKPEMNAEISARVALERNLRLALKNQQFLLVYQPQLDLARGEVVSMEALIRWQHPTLGFISPLQFIPVAEELGLINQIGKFVLETACRQNKKWQQAGYKPLRVAVNVSSKEIQEAGFLENLKEILVKTDLEPQWLELEITESAAVQDFASTIRFLEKVREMGIMVSLDDFGTGYSSLNYLKRLPISQVKIDKSFVDNMRANSTEEQIAKTIITLAHNLKLEVVAEGVETEGQLALLKAYGCDKIQGYFFSKPLSEQEFIKFVLL